MRDIFSPNLYNAIRQQYDKENVVERNGVMYIFNQIDSIGVYWSGEFVEYSGNEKWKRFNLKFWKSLIMNGKVVFDKNFELVKNKENLSESEYVEVEWVFGNYWLQLFDIFEFEWDLLTAIDTLTRVSTKRWFRYVNTDDVEILREEENQIKNLTSPFINILSVLNSKKNLENEFENMENKATNDILNIFMIAKEHFAFKLDRLGYQTYENKNKKERLTENESDLLSYNTNNVQKAVENMLEVMCLDLKEKFGIELNFIRKLEMVENEEQVETMEQDIEKVEVESEV